VPAFLWFVSFTAKRNEHYKRKNLSEAFFQESGIKEITKSIFTNVTSGYKPQKTKPNYERS
jgi:hypothetical protein